MAWGKLPHDGQGRGLCRVDDDFCEGLTLLQGNQDDLFEQVFWIVALDEGDDEGRVRLGIEVADCYAGALTLMRIFPDLPLGRGEIEGGQNLPVVLLDGRFERIG